MDTYFCSLGCPCDSQYQANFASEGGDEWTWSPTGASRVNDCPGFDTYFGDDQDIVNALVPILRHAEKSLQCSGLCSPGKTYLFAGLSEGIPPERCWELLHDFFDDLMKPVFYVLCTLYLLCLFAFFCNLANCCRDRDREEAEERAKRDAYYTKQLRVNSR